MNLQATAILDFYKGLRPNFRLPEGISIMNPYKDELARETAEIFYKKFYSDARPRIFIFGINPGRFGGGITGVPFTDPIRLQDPCGIPNNWKKTAELSSQFVYEMIGAYGGVQPFYRDFYITALFPLGFVKAGKNLNYYDDKELLKACEPFIIRSIRRQLETIPSFDTCFCLGEGANYKHFLRFNEEHRFFKEIIPLPHPRWVMQYRRKTISLFVDSYIGKLADAAKRFY